jgi:RNA polymerase sigma-70 factor (ECF subfamily)
VSEVSSTAGHDEAELIAKLRAGDPGATEAWVRASTPRLLAVTRRMLRSEEDARDAVQDAFISAFRALDGFEGGSQLSTWLHRIAVNAALMKLRTRRRKPEESIDDLLPNFFEDGHHNPSPTEWPGSAQDWLERDEVRRGVQEAISRLPETHRNVLVLRDIEELDTAEVAKLLEITPGAVKTRLHRARLALRELLDPVLLEEAG